jgi:hypothetical protein
MGEKRFLFGYIDKDIRAEAGHTNENPNRADHGAA